jgi:hypothetical protein
VANKRTAAARPLRRYVASGTTGDGVFVASRCGDIRELSLLSSAQNAGGGHFPRVTFFSPDGKAGEAFEEKAYSEPELESGAKCNGALEVGEGPTSP